MVQKMESTKKEKNGKLESEKLRETKKNIRNQNIK